MRADFELVIEYDKPVAALLRTRLPDQQLSVIYRLLPQSSICQHVLAIRWNLCMVLAPDDWASAQLRRVPMFPPAGTKLSFV